MLIEFRVSNFRSFADEQVLSLVASDGTDHPSNLIAGVGSAHGLRFNKAAAVFGANASGKSNLIKAIGVAATFVRISATRMNLGDRIPGLSPFRLSNVRRGQPCKFAWVFVCSDARYEYGFSADSERVHEEWLIAWAPGGQQEELFWRRFERATNQTSWSFSDSLAQHRQVLESRTRDNGLVLSRGAELNIQPLGLVFGWVTTKCVVVDHSQQAYWWIFTTAEAMRKDNSFHDCVVRLMKHADVGIDSVAFGTKGIDVHWDPDTPIEIRAPFDAMRSHLPPEQIAILTRHDVDCAEGGATFDLLDDESEGTKRLFGLAGLFLIALRSGSVLVVDELDCSLHPLLSRKLIELFQSPDANPNGAQLVFTTHDSTLMDPVLFRRDQVWFAEKGATGASELLSLDEFERRRKEDDSSSLQRDYLAGRFGAIPSFGPMLEDLRIQ